MTPRGPSFTAKFIGVICAVALLQLGASHAGVASAAPAGVHWAEQFLAEAVARKILLGYPDGSVRPDGLITRAEFAALLTRMLGEEHNADTARRLTPYFSDVLPSFWASGYIELMRQYGVLLGDDVGRANPESHVSRAESFTMLARLMRWQGTPVPEGSYDGFADEGDIPEWAADSVRLLSLMGLVKGDDHGLVRPHAKLTRAEAAVLCLRALEALGARWDMVATIQRFGNSPHALIVECQGQVLQISAVEGRTRVFDDGRELSIDALAPGSTVGIQLHTGGTAEASVLVILEREER